MNIEDNIVTSLTAWNQDGAHDKHLHAYLNPSVVAKACVELKELRKQLSNDKLASIVAKAAAREAEAMAAARQAKAAEQLAILVKRLARISTMSLWERIKYCLTGVTA